jgi:hypothetical protein
MEQRGRRRKRKDRRRIKKNPGEETALIVKNN